MKGRQRGRNGGKPRPHQPGGHRNHNFDANVGRMRGNAQQLLDKYLALARDANSQGDRVMAENYYQHADHYYRVINARFEGQPNNQRRFNGQPYDRADRPFEGTDQQQGGYGDYNRVDIPPPVTTQSLGVQAIGTQPYVGQPAPGIGHGMPQAEDQMLHSQQPMPQTQPQAMPPPHADQDIGLPPQLFGGPPPQSNPGTESQDDPAEPQQGFDGNRGDRQRFGGRRRRGPRPQHPPVNSAD
ncbi:MAG: DUF4167 domain-containing protein [Rhodospirillaceae bacterium]|nr:DUF4167 domain-containing protein [Rhodospirillaceae bacterium]